MGLIFHPFNHPCHFLLDGLHSHHIPPPGWRLRVNWKKGPHDLKRRSFPPPSLLSGLPCSPWSREAHSQGSVIHDPVGALPFSHLDDLHDQKVTKIQAPPLSWFSPFSLPMPFCFTAPAPPGPETPPLWVHENRPPASFPAGCLIQANPLKASFGNNFLNQMSFLSHPSLS